MLVVEFCPGDSRRLWLLLVSGSNAALSSTQRTKGLLWLTGCSTTGCLLNSLIHPFSHREPSESGCSQICVGQAVLRFLLLYIYIYNDYIQTFDKVFICPKLIYNRCLSDLQGLYINSDQNGSRSELCSIGRIRKAKTWGEFIFINIQIALISFWKDLTNYCSSLKENLHKKVYIQPPTQTAFLRKRNFI